MNDRLSKIKEQYREALSGCFMGMGEAPLQRAYELGREAIATGMGVLDVEELFQEALLEVLPGVVRPREKAKQIKIAFSFFRESLAPFELTHRSFQEANTELRQLTASLEQQVAERTEALRERTRRLEALHRVTNTALSSLNLKELAQNIASDLDSILNTGFVSIMMASEERRELMTLGFVSHLPESLKSALSIPIEKEHAITRILISGQPLIIEDIQATQIPPDTREAFKRTGIKTRSILQLPLRVREKTIGILGLGWPDPRKFTPEDVDFFALLANEVAIGINNARLYEAERHIADTLQKSLLIIPERIAGVEYGYLYKSATEAVQVGGDFYDIFELEHEKIAIVIGDVSGKGIEAAIVTSVVKNAIRAYIYEDGTPAIIISKTNDLVARVISPGNFITIFFALLDTRTGKLSYCSAGHPPAIIKREKGGVDLLEKHSPVIGAFPGMHYRTVKVKLERGDILVLYTDGIIEARRGREFFAETRLIELVRSLKTLSAKEIPRAIFNIVSEFADGKLTDDIAILAASLMNLQQNHQR